MSQRLRRSPPDVVYTPIDVTSADGTLCVNCGWRKADVPPEIQTQVEAHLGTPYMEERYTHSRIGTGKPPLNGWERVKRRREREKAAM